MNNLNIKIKIILAVLVLLLSGCEVFKPKKVDLRKRPVDANERARQNVNEGRGISLGSLTRSGGTNYEFSTSNPLWRASLETLDFIPMTTVDYSGGVIITDWYSIDNSNDSLKITIRFLSNEVQSSSIKVIVHNKKCKLDAACTINEIDSKIKFEIQKTILAKAAELELQSKNKKK